MQNGIRVWVGSFLRLRALSPVQPRLQAGWWLGCAVDRRGLPHGDQVLSDDPGPLGFGAEEWVLSFVISGHA